MRSSRSAQYIPRAVDQQRFPLSSHVPHRSSCPRLVLLRIVTATATSSGADHKPRANSSRFYGNRQQCSACSVCFTRRQIVASVHGAESFSSFRFGGPNSPLRANVLEQTCDQRTSDYTRHNRTARSAELVTAAKSVFWPQLANDDSYDQ